ncbi:MAG: hypothetical protein JKX91_04810 [Rhizobiaceae bacterium]|nr:hypothetical protein [Rhizobiaceae bacterium]PCI02739.1 MAG: hypothetical protein COB78_12170 [Hyphomicrobiales bacterium]
MRVPFSLKVLLPILVCTNLAATNLATYAQTTTGNDKNQPWLDLITGQMAREKQCEVGFFVYFREGNLGGMSTYEARVQCVDGRQFDATKIEPAIMFEIKECAVTVC